MDPFFVLEPVIGGHFDRTVSILGGWDYFLVGDIGPIAPQTDVWEFLGSYLPDCVRFTLSSRWADSSLKEGVVITAHVDVNADHVSLVHWWYDLCLAVY